MICHNGIPFTDHPLNIVLLIDQLTVLEIIKRIQQVSDMENTIKANHTISGRLAGGKVGSYLDCTN